MTVIERRAQAGTVELRAESEGEDQPVATGYAAVFGRRSVDLGGFTEIIDPKAFERTITQADVVALFNHDDDRLLGRIAAGTLRLTTDDRGLGYEVDLPDTTIGRDVAVLLGRGDVRGSSFAFRTVRDEWHEDDQGVITRTLLEVELIDVSPVTRPAYPDTDAALRSLAAATDHDLPEVREAAEARNLGALLVPGRDEDDHSAEDSARPEGIAVRRSALCVV